VLEGIPTLEGFLCWRDYLDWRGYQDKPGVQDLQEDLVVSVSGSIALTVTLAAP
jgi:hypothetical protein